MQAKALVGGKLVSFKLFPELARAHRTNTGKSMSDSEAVTFVEKKRRSFALRRSFLAALLLLPLTLAAAESTKKPVLLYSRYFNARGETRYQPDGNYKEVLTRLRGEFEVHVHANPLNAKTLAGVNAVLIANPSDKAAGTNPPPNHVAAADIAALTQFVQSGGGLIILGNQEAHNLETTDLNRLLAQFGLQLLDRHTDIKFLPLPKATPVIGGLSWLYYSGDQVVLSVGHPAKPRALVSNDVSIKPINGPRNEPGCLLATAEPGKGRVVLITDAGWITDDSLAGKPIGEVTIKGADNWEIMRRLTRWAAQK